MNSTIVNYWLKIFVLCVIRQSIGRASVRFHWIKNYWLCCFWSFHCIPDRKWSSTDLVFCLCCFTKPFWVPESLKKGGRQILGNFTGFEIQWSNSVQLSYYGVCYMKMLLGHICPIHSTWVRLTSLPGGLSPIATGTGNECKASVVPEVRG